ncbi:MAG TPA: uracil-DNA glycosylase [Caulobacterales bacterium]|nr:uracil-DNA glycosylase [Caulobacterales bacterium]
MDEAEAVYAAAPAVASPARGESAGRTAHDEGDDRTRRPPLGPSPPSRPRPVSGKAQPSPIDDARALAASAASIAELRAAVDGFTGCGLKATARNTVFSDGADDAQVLLIGEAPGKDEDEQGKPFVGRSGQLLDRMLATIGLDRRKNLLISNTIFWRPPGNRPPTQGEFAACMPFCERLIELAQPKLLILAGGVAAQTVLKREDGVMRMRGRRLTYNREGRPLSVNTLVMLHPAYLLRRPQEKRLAWGDLLLLESWLTELGVERVSHL